MARYYPKIDDNNWREQSGQIAMQTSFADYLRARRLELIQQQEAVDHGMTRYPLFTWTWSDAVEGSLAFFPSSSLSLATRYLFRGPYDPDAVPNLADNAVTFRGEACLLSILDIGNALRTMSIEDQERFKFQMSRVLSITRLLETRCQGLFTGLIDAQRNDRKEIAKKKKARKERVEMRLELAEAKSDLAKSASTLASVRQQYFEQQEELNDDKIALGVLLDEERSTAYDLRQNLKKTEASIACLNTKLSALESGARDKKAVRNDLQMKLTAAAAAEATSMSKWNAEQQQLRDEIARAQREERRAKQPREDTTPV